MTDAPLLRFADGVTGMLWASQVAPGNANALRLRVFGEKGGLTWAQEDPGMLRLAMLGEPPRLITRGSPAAGPAASRLTRLPVGCRGELSSLLTKDLPGARGRR